MKGTTSMRETGKAMKADMIAGWCEPEEKIGEPDIRFVRGRDLAAKYHIPEREMRDMQPAFSTCDQDV